MVRRRRSGEPRRSQKEATETEDPCKDQELPQDVPAESDFRIRTKQSERSQNPAEPQTEHTCQTEHTVPAGDALDAVQQEEEKEEQLEEISRRLILKEEELFRQESPNEEAEDQLQQDFEALGVRIWMAIQDTFTSSPPSAEHLEVLRSAVASIQQQEQQDQRWTENPENRVPVWRPHRYLSTHNMLLQKMVVARLRKAAEEEEVRADQLSSEGKRQVCRVGKCVKEDLLTVVRKVKDCYPLQMDILNVYAGLYHRTFSAHLTEMAFSNLDIEDCSYLLFWINNYYPNEILKHKELDGQIKTAYLGSLLLPDQLDRLEDQYLSHKEDQVKLWLNTALRKEEMSWLSGNTPELIDGYFFSSLAVDVIQVMSSSLKEINCAIKDQNKAQRLTALMENFLCSYKKCVEDFLSGNHGNMHPVMKGQLVCEQQLRDYISGQTESLSEAQRHGCMDTLSALRDVVFMCFTCPFHSHIKVCLKQLWTSAWVDGSLPVIDSLLDHLEKHLCDLNDLKPVCRAALLSVLYQDVAFRYVKKMIKTKMKNREQQEAGAQLMIQDAQKIDNFFTEKGCSEASWIRGLLCSLAELLQLQDPASIQLELVMLARTFPDLSGAHVSALLSVKFGLSAADVSSIRKSVEKNRLHNASANHSHPFFSNIKVKWLTNKINQMGLKS
ncbi:tumor necrosis factor alpha-induced protein 2a isoform X3 [Melanotaenia boesemani]|uniref:tumor necrosis factor alpha-induced protein 2a isoform X3 n=1 Tax=Melanotaenia boesemani TaxID=1250792 RepID=UPI001C04F690|nr:tumor necrosis factor alpha-induced protein 2a isoform X3 [Melanotaenia boesemani]